MLKSKSITIIGAGPSGLTLARLLQIRGLKVKVFELEPSVESRDQGGTFDLHKNGGQKALMEAKLFDEFKRLSRPEGEEMRVGDQEGKVLFEIIGKPENFDRPEIDRLVLRKMLLDSLEPDTVVWSKQIANVEPLDYGQHRIFFKDGETEIADFLVGADGTWSKIRPLLSPIGPVYCGITIVETRIAHPKVTTPYIDKLVGQGLVFMLGNNRGLLPQRNGDQSIRVYVTLRVPENWVQGFDFGQPAAIRSMLLCLFPDWKPELLDMINKSDDLFVPRPLYARPLDQYWATKQGVTVIGDAAHVMSPFAGQGANQAMVDALELADALTSKDVTDITSLTWVVTSFEETMIDRARKAAFQTQRNLDVIMSEDAPNTMAKVMQMYTEGGRIIDED